MNNRPSASNLSSSYNYFLFAPICEQANGMQLSVLSALARMDVDPWNEATRLAALPKAIAESTLVSTLDVVPGRNWNPSETKAIAARLVQLLPQHPEAATIAATEIAGLPQRTSYWLVWVGFAIAMSFLSPHHQAATTDTGVSTSQSGATSASPSGGADGPSPGKSGQPH